MAFQIYLLSTASSRSCELSACLPAVPQQIRKSKLIKLFSYATKFFIPLHGVELSQQHTWIPPAIPPQGHLLAHIPHSPPELIILRKTVSDNDSERTHLPACLPVCLPGGGSFLELDLELNFSAHRVELK